MRECGRCGDVKKLVAFATFRSRRGKLRRRGICKTCREKQLKRSSEEMRLWRKKYNARTKSKRAQQSAARRAVARAFVNAYKDRPCADCGNKFPPVAMDLDHVRGGKARCIANLVSGAYKIDLIAAELKKCEVVCACCHRIRTAARKENVGHVRWKKRASERLLVIE